MKLENILSEHDFYLATPEHDSELQEIFEDIPMRVGPILFSTQRRPSYFSFTELRSERHFTFFTRDSVTKRIASVGCLSLRSGYHQGEKTTIGFFGDMRSHFSRETSRKWRNFYGSLVAKSSQCEELNYCSKFYTTILQPNRRALQAYVKQGRNPFRYDPLSDCELINIYGRLRPSIGPDSKDQFRVRTAEASDFDKLCRFLDSENRGRVFGFCFPEELERRLACWKGFTLERFFIVEDKNANIQAVAAPWSPGESQQIVLETLPQATHWFSKIMRQTFLRRWIRFPSEGEPLEILYLTHFHVASELKSSRKAEVTSLLLDSIYDSYRKDDWHVMSLPVFAREKLEPALQGYLYHRIPLKVYSVHSPKQDLKAETTEYDTSLPGIEISLI